jgi:hypothetical protein
LENETTETITNAIQSYEFAFINSFRGIFLSSEMLATCPEVELKEYHSFLKRLTEAEGLKKAPIIFEIVSKIKSNKESEGEVKQNG